VNKSLPSWVGQSIRFAAVAPLVFLADYGLLAMLSGLGVNDYAGRLASLGGSVVAGFLLNRFFTFRASGRPTLAEARAYALAAMLGIGVNYAVFAAAIALSAPHALAILSGMLAAALVTFLRFRDLFAKARPSADV
jgi:putative flippase GtrA